MKKKGLLVGYCVCLLAAVVLRKPFVQAIAVMNNQSLQGTKIVIDAGHGGKDPGARVSNQDEDQINLDLALKLKNVLEKAGAYVELTRYTDDDLSDENAENVKRSDMKHRAEMLNQHDVTLFISIHCNTSADQRCSGSQVYYRKNDEQSRKLADSIQSRLREITESKYIPASGDFYLLNETKNVGVLVEAGFLTNEQDLKKLQTEKYREELAFGIYMGIRDYLRIML